MVEEGEILTSSETAIARQSLALFGLEGSLRRVAQGLDTSYRVKTATGKVYALRVASGMAIRPVSAFQVEAGWIDALADNPWLQVPPVQRTTAGERVGQVQDASGTWRASTLLAWLPGRRQFRPTAAQVRALGQTAGALHQHARAADRPPAGAIKTWDARLMCLMPKDPGQGLQRVAPEVVDAVQRVYGALQRRMETIEASELGLINADLGVHNVLWHKGRAGLVDFNDAGIGPYAFCLARLVGRIRAEEHGAALVEELLQGYRQVAPLPAAYEAGGDLFELAADVFRLNYGAGRAVRRGTGLRANELDLARTLQGRLARLGL